ncbi:phosphodiester glycosidase family protein [bacterium]|nr:phosphodiester glycosidase family protein [bacterium]
MARGAQEALNLDVGGSSTMLIQNEIVNRPSDYAVPGQPGRERAVANVVALLKKSQ